MIEGITPRDPAAPPPAPETVVMDYDSLPLLELLPDYYAVIDPDGIILWVSERGPDRTGYTAEELTGTQAYQYMHPDDAALAVSGVAMGLARPERLTAVPERFLHKDGSIVLFETLARVGQLRMPDGSTQAVIFSSLRDLDTRTAMEAVLQSVAADQPDAATLALIAQMASPETLACLTGVVVGGIERDELQIEPGPVPPVLFDRAAYGREAPPWEEAAASGERVMVDDFSRYPAAVRTAIEDAGLLGAVAIPVDDPGSPQPAVLVSWCDFDLSMPVVPIWLETQVVPVLRVALEQRRARARLEWAASYDSLTGLANRARLFDVLRRTLGRLRGNERVGILYLDLDGFKAVNDTLGHAAGDEVLTEVARRFGDAVRPQDIIGRLGGDEFALVSPGCQDAEQLTAIGNRLVESLAEPVVLSSGQEVRIGVSVGAIAAGEGISADDALKRADVALYFAKRHGRGAVHVGPAD